MLKDLAEIGRLSQQLKELSWEEPHHQVMKDEIAERIGFLTRKVWAETIGYPF